MNVLLISVSSDFGGGPKHMNQLIDNMPQDVNLYGAYPKDGNPYGEIWDNCVRLKDKLYISKREFSLSDLIKLIHFIKKHRIEIIHSQGNGAGIYARFLKAIGCKIKVVHSFHGVSTYPSFVREMAMRGANVFFRKYTDCFISATKSELAEARKKKYVAEESNVKLVFNGVKRVDAQRVEDSTFNIVTIARFIYQKNMKFCYEIAKSFVAYDKIKFIWIGDGVDYKELKDKAVEEHVENITFVGFTTEYMKYLSNADVYLSTARFEGLPYSLVEATSLGLPIIATDVVGNNDCVEDGTNGFLFTTKEEAIKYIKMLYTDENLRHRMSTSAKEFFENHFNEDKMIANIYRVYCDVLK